MFTDTKMRSGLKAIGEEDAYALWQGVEHWAILKISTYRVFSEEDREDILSQVREKFVEKIHTLKDPTKLRAWTDRLAQNFCNTLYSQYLRQSELTVPLSEDQEWPSSEKTPEEVYEDEIKAKLLDRVFDLIKKLPPEHYKIVEEVVILNKERLKDLADEEGVVPSTISHRRDAAIENLRKLIEQEAQHDEKFARTWEEYGADLLVDG